MTHAAAVTSATPALDHALAEIGRRFNTGRIPRQNADHRIQRLREIKAAMGQPVIGDGYFGGLQMFNSLASVGTIREGRIGCLMRARIHQLDGKRGPAQDELASAARRRVTEREVRAEELDRLCARTIERATAQAVA